MLYLHERQSVLAGFATLEPSWLHHLSVCMQNKDLLTFYTAGVDLEITACVCGPWLLIEEEGQAQILQDLC